MDFLKAEIERKKRQMEEKKLMGPDKKYFKRSDLSAKEREEYLAIHAPNPQDVRKKVEEIEKVKEEARRELLSSTSSGSDKLPRSEVIRRLREKLKPILLFGETEEQACQRLTKLEVDESDLLQAAGSRNEFKEALAKVDKEYLEQIITHGDKEIVEKSKPDSKMFDSTFTYEQLIDMGNELGKGDISHDYQVVGGFITTMMTMWKDELAKKSESLRMSVKGKMEHGTHEQTKLYLKPLLRMIKKQTVPDDIRDSLVVLVKHTLQRDYILANETYMEMAIGNAPWPIGVTNAGIHARPGREKIFSKNVAHVLNDELQRKFIQGLKRLITKAQQYFPTDPSRSIDFVRKDDQ